MLKVNPSISHAEINTLSTWQALAQFHAFLADHDLRLGPFEPAGEMMAYICEALAVSLELGICEPPVIKTWGKIPKTTAPEDRWELILPLAHSSGRGQLHLYGEGAAHQETKRAAALAVAAALDTSLFSRQLLDEERSQRVLAESLVEISRILNSTLDLEEVLVLILSRLADLVPYDSANVMLLQDGQLTMHAAQGYQDCSGPLDVSSISFVPARTVLMEEVLEGSQPIILADTLDLPNWVWVPCGKHIRSWMGVPLRVKDQVIGLFSIDKSLPNFFTQHHAELASALATHAALALANARLFAQLRETQEQLCGLSAQVIAAQEQERQKIAVELHDHAGQALLGLRAELQILKHHLPPEQRTSSAALEQIKYLDEVVLEICQDLRQLAHDLRPPILAELGLIPALEQYIDEFSRRMNMPSTFAFQHEQQVERLPENIELICYRIIQEALTNLAKHAQASKVKISLNLMSEQLILSVVDDGIGFSPHLKKEVEGFGLIGIRERVTAVGGHLQIFSQPGRGTQLTVAIPLNTDTASRQTIRSSGNSA